MDTKIPYTPQLNGKAERLNRIILEKFRSLMFDSILKQTFWGETASVATYIQNRSPTKTPYEMWTNKKPDISQ